MYLLDTNVVSELRKAKSGKANHGVVTWADEVPSSSLYISVISILELEMGILSVQRKDEPQGAILREWMDNHVLPAFEDRILPIDTLVAQQCARLHVPDPKSDRDALISATGIVHSMIIVTRNITDFEVTGVALIDPWS